MKKLTVDHIEGIVAICYLESGDKTYVLDEDLPKGAKAGDCLFEDRSGNLHIDMIATKGNQKSAAK